ncbi:MAG: outer membrane beta-barrel protein [Bacteroidales bacterium]
MKTNVFVLLGLLMMVSSATFSQNTDKRFAFELNGGAAFPLTELNNTNLNTGIGFEGIFHYRFMAHTGVFAGWGWNRFAADQSFAGDDVCFEETGYIFGLQFMHPIADSRFSYYFRAGGLYNHIETENADGEIINDSKHGLGYQLGGGINYNLSNNWSLNMGVKYNSLNRESTFEGVTKSLDYKYISAVRAGIVKHF